MAGATIALFNVMTILLSLTSGIIVDLPPIFRTLS